MRGSSKNTVQNDNIIHIVASIVDNLPQGITVTDSDGLIIYVNSSAERISGYTRDELIGKHLEVLNWEKDNETCFRKVFSGILHSGGWRGEILQRHKDGRSFLSHLEISPVSGSGETVAWVCAQREITTARQTRQQELISDALRESEKRYRSLVEQIPAITYIALPDDASTPIYVSPQVERYLSISSSHYLSSPDIWRRHLHPDDRRRVLDDLQQCHTTNQRFLSEYRMLSADGRVVWFHDEAVLIRDENGNPQYLQGVKYDITKQKQTQEALRKSAEQHRLIVETANEGICMVDADDKISFINKQLVEMIGFTKDELLGKSVFDFFDDNGKAFVSEALRRRRQGLREQVDLKYPGKDGRDIFLLVSVSPVIDNEGNYAGTLAMVTDISDRQQYENDLRLSEERFSKAFKSNPNPMSITTIKEGVCLNKRK